MVLFEPKTPLQECQQSDPVPSRGEVLVRIEACAVCRTDLHVIDGELPNPKMPIIPGHEVIGTIDELGPDTHPWKVGQRVGVGWAGFQCGYCHPCRQGDLALCENTKVTGIHIDGGALGDTIGRGRIARLLRFETLDSPPLAPPYEGGE